MTQSEGYQTPVKRLDYDFKFWRSFVRITSNEVLKTRRHFPIRKMESWYRGSPQERQIWWPLPSEGLWLFGVQRKEKKESTALGRIPRGFLSWAVISSNGQLVEMWTWSFCGLRGCWPCGNFSSSGGGRYITTVRRRPWESDPHEFQSHSATDSQVMSDNLRNLSSLSPPQQWQDDNKTYISGLL